VPKGRTIILDFSFNPGGSILNDLTFSSQVRTLCGWRRNHRDHQHTEGGGRGSITTQYLRKRKEDFEEKEKREDCRDPSQREVVSREKAILPASSLLEEAITPDAYSTKKGGRGKKALRKGKNVIRLTGVKKGERAVISTHENPR